MLTTQYDYGDVVHVRRGQRLYRAYLDERLRLPDWEPPSLPLREVDTIERALPAMSDEVGGSIVGADVWHTLGLKTTTKHRRKQ